MPNQNGLQGEFIINKDKPETQNKVPQPLESGANQTPAEGTGKVRFFSNFCINPSDVNFENQEADEKIVLLIRRDLITNLPWIIAVLILIFIPFIISAFSNLFTPFFNISTQNQLIALLFYYLIILGFVLVQFTLWYFSVGLVTNRRIIDFDVSGILYKQVSETKLNLVEDVTYTQNGSIRSIFDYGDIFVQTAGTHENFEFDRAPSPAKIVRIIADLIGGPR